MNASAAELLGRAAGIVSFLAVIMYAVSIVRGKTRPNKITWWVATFVGVMILIPYLIGMNEKNKATMWLPIVYVVGPFIFALLSLKYGEIESDEKVDTRCLKISLMSIVLWGTLLLSGFQKSALIILTINLFSDFVGLYPTIIKSMKRPESEDKWAWLIAVVAGVLNVLAIREWSAGESIYQIYFLATNCCITFFLFRKF